MNSSMNASEALQNDGLPVHPCSVTHPNSSADDVETYEPGLFTRFCDALSYNSVLSRILRVLRTSGAKNGVIPNG
jgi:hypothetical protein